MTIPQAAIDAAAFAGDTFFERLGGPRRHSNAALAKVMIEAALPHIAGTEGGLSRHCPSCGADKQAMSCPACDWDTMTDQALRVLGTDDSEPGEG